MPKLGRNSGVVVLTTTNATRLTGPNPNRRALVVSIQGTTAAYVSVDFGDSGQDGRGVNVQQQAGPYEFKPDVYG